MTILENIISFYYFSFSLVMHTLKEIGARQLKNATTSFIMFASSLAYVHIVTTQRYLIHHFGTVSRKRTDMVFTTLLAVLLCSNVANFLQLTWGR